MSGHSTDNRGAKAAHAFRTISEVAAELGLPQHVLRFWESKFPQIKPLKRGGGRRYYRPEDIEMLIRIRDWLHKDGYTIKGVQKLLKGKPLDEADALFKSVNEDGVDKSSLSDAAVSGLQSVLSELRQIRSLLG